MPALQFFNTIAPTNNIVGSVILYERTNCNECGQGFPLEKYYKCVECRMYDLCETCMRQGIHSQHMLVFVSHHRPPQSRTQAEGNALQRS